MDAGYTISEVASRTGFSASALRFYEDAGLVTPARSASGYRVYDDRAVERLRFISRGKQLGLSLDEIAELVALWDDDRCGPVAHRMRVLLGEKLRATRERVWELSAFAATLEGVRTGLAIDPGEGPCGDGCACQAADPVPVAIACTLPADRVDRRVDDWQALSAEADEVRRDGDGAVLRFRPDPALAARVATLAAAEQSCCSFFRFTVRLDATGTELAVEAPPEAASLVDALLGVPAAAR
jgi:DNA-binding transcriptional MerR regulator